MPVSEKWTSNGIITTVAGNGTGSYSGDGGPATNAELYLPRGVAVDLAGNLYIADSGNNRIREVTTGGVISTVAGKGTSGFLGDGGLATKAWLDLPFCVALDSQTNLYIGDSFNQRVRKVIGGIINTVATTTALMVTWAKREQCRDGGIILSVRFGNQSRRRFFHRRQR